MAATSGLLALSAANVEQDLLNHLTPASGTTATAITVTGPLKVALLTAVSTNTAVGAECTDANYARQSVTSWNAPATTSGEGYAAGVTNKTNAVALTFGGSTGFAVAQTITGIALYSSDATPVGVYYENFATNLGVPINNQVVFGVGQITLGIS